MTTANKRKRGGKRYIAALCSNTYQDGVLLFHFPWDANLAELWPKEVRKTRDAWTGYSKHSILCSSHFEANCFKLDPHLFGGNWEKPEGHKPEKNLWRREPMVAAYNEPPVLGYQFNPSWDWRADGCQVALGGVIAPTYSKFSGPTMISVNIFVPKKTNEYNFVPVSQL